MSTSRGPGDRPHASADAGVLERLLGRALGVGDVEGAPPAPGPVTRPRTRPRTRRRPVNDPRRAATVGLLVVLAGAAVVTAHRPHASADAPAPRPAPVRPPPTARRGNASPRPSGDGAARLEAMLPPGARCDVPAAPAPRATCTVGAVAVDYRLVGTAAVAAAYRAAVGPTTPVAAQGTGHGTQRGAPACACGVDDERSWSRPAQPQRAVGRYACRLDQGSAAMWWTVDDRGLLAHAAAPHGDLAALFTWWLAHADA